MNIEDAKANIGKKVVLLPETNPYSNAQYEDLWKKVDLYGLSEGELLNVDDGGDVVVAFEGQIDDDGNEYTFTCPFNPKHIALVESEARRSVTCSKSVVLEALKTMV